MMKCKTREEDRKAIDLLMDRGSATGKLQGTLMYAATDGRIRERVSRVEKVLELLDSMPVSDPSPDLLARTLRFVAQSASQQVSRGRPAHPAYAHHPVA